eukprot:4650574-Amphidinium_carterae.8
MGCGAYTTGHWGLLKHACVQDMGSRTAQVHRIRRGRFPDNKVKCQVILGAHVAAAEIPHFWKVSDRPSRQLWKL